MRCWDHHVSIIDPEVVETEYRMSAAALIRKVDCTNFPGSILNKFSLSDDNPARMGRSALVYKRLEVARHERYLAPPHVSGQHADLHLLQPAQRAGLFLLHISLLSPLALQKYSLVLARQTKLVPSHLRPQCAVQTPSLVLRPLSRRVPVPPLRS